MKRLAILASLALGGATAVHAQRVSPISGGRLLGVCTAPSAGSLTSCDAYVSGIADTFAVLQAMGRDTRRPQQVPAMVCIPSTITAVQLRGTVVSWLRAHPAQGAKQAAPLVMSALRAAYPCASGPL